MIMIPLVYVYHYNADRNLQFSMTKWGLRCLRWLKTPYDSIVRVYGLIKGLQHQIV